MEGWLFIPRHQGSDDDDFRATKNEASVFMIDSNKYHGIEIEIFKEFSNAVLSAVVFWRMVLIDGCSPHAPD